VALDGVGHHLLEELLLRFEVVVERADGDVGLLGDVANGDRLEATRAGDDTSRGCDQARPRLTPPTLSPGLPCCRRSIHVGKAPAPAADF